MIIGCEFHPPAIEPLICSVNQHNCRCLSNSGNTTCFIDTLFNKMWNQHDIHQEDYISTVGHANCVGDDTIVFSFLGLISAIKGNYAETCFRFEKIIKEGDTSTETYLRFALCLLRFGQFVQAANYAALAAKASAYLDRNSLCLAISTAICAGRFKEAQDLCQKMLVLTDEQNVPFFDIVEKAVSQLERSGLTDNDMLDVVTMYSDFMLTHKLFVKNVEVTQSLTANDSDFVHTAINIELFSTMAEACKAEKQLDVIYDQTSNNGLHELETHLGYSFVGKLIA